MGRDKRKTETVQSPEKPLANTDKPQGKLEKCELYLPPEHPINKLWEIYSSKISQIPQPVIRLEGESDELKQFLSDEYLSQELPRLERSLTSVAERRLEEFPDDDDKLTPDLDAKVQLFMTSDKVTAWIIIYPPIGAGNDFDKDMIQKTLGMSRVSFGINENLFEDVSKLNYFQLYLVACGTLPVHGKDGYIIDCFSRNHVGVLSEDEHGRVDYAALEIFQNVKKGDVICRVVEPTPCTDGWAVTDEKCYAHVGKPATVPKGRNTELSEDGSCLLATIEGHVEFSGRSFQVKPVMEIGGNVDFSTGNINCLGDIHIHGDVNSGFTVRATGNITVDGVIEACVVEAGSDLVVRKGVQGNNKAVLRAHRNIFAKYIESSSVYVRENLETECLVNCNVYSDGKVTVRSGRGTIIGGQVCAAQGVSANIVGARSECLTSIKLGGRPCEAFEREGLASEIVELESEMEKLSRQPDNPTKSRQLSKMRMQISANKLKLQQFDKQLEKMDTSHADCGKLVCGTIYPGAEITIGGVSHRVMHENRMCTATLVAGEVALI